MDKGERAVHIRIVQLDVQRAGHARIAPTTESVAVVGVRIMVGMTGGVSAFVPRGDRLGFFLFVVVFLLIVIVIVIVVVDI